MINGLLHPTSCLAVTVALLWTLWAGAQGATQQKQKEDGLHMATQQLQIAKEEMQRRHKVKQQRNSFETPRDYMVALYRRTIEGNRHDYEVNKKRYERLAAQAAELKDSKKEERAQMVEAAASLYRQAALANRAIVLAFTEKDPRLGHVLQEKSKEIMKLEREYRELTKSEMTRSWVTEDEYTAYVTAYYERAAKR